ncbi:hypothetical protein F5146DRAFT_1141906 [Armillaria mellea]|nr:hypothetical protein F5146DRAFT_1141906 [Armillaria mellea]
MVWAFCHAEGRIAGRKGLWIIHPSDFDDEHKIWTQPSQRKINYEQLDYSHCILDIISFGYPSSSSTLSAQSNLNLSFNGAPNAILVELLKEGLAKTVDPPIEKKGRFSDVSLWTAVNQAGEWHDPIVYNDKWDNDKKIPVGWSEE